MDNSDKLAGSDPNGDGLLKSRLRQLLGSKPLDTQRHVISSIADELNTDTLACAAALLYLVQTNNLLSQPLDITAPAIEQVGGIKMVRYRLDVGSQHQVTLEDIKKVLVEESGVDKNNINNIAIRGLYTLIELPDAMPPDIFQHLKTVEINQQKLDIRRVKARNNKKRGFQHNRRGRPRNQQSSHGVSDQING
ncbi:MAG: DbpA RNA binding domain-containing protein [Methylovulum sp.]|nr:DbpA RNA binding domain-containing protein [Methylovulum sp.]